MFIPNYIAEKNEWGRVSKIVDPILYRCWMRNHREDKDTLIGVFGETGSRKSGFSISMSLMLDVIKKTANPNLTQFTSPLKPESEQIQLREHPTPDYYTRFSLYKVFYTATDLIKLIRADPPLPSGTALIWDEVGVEADARDFMQVKNKLINHVFRTVRQFNFYFFITTPTLSDFDVGLKRNLKAYVEMDEKFVHPNFARGKFMWVQVNPKSGKAYIKKMRYEEDERRNRLDWYYMQRPPAWFEKPYKAWKRKASEDLYKNIDFQIQKAEEYIKGGQRDDKKKVKSLNDLKKEILEDEESFINPHNGRFSSSLIEMLIEGVGKWEARQLASGLNALRAQGKI